jgi:hypothetical protein
MGAVPQKIRILPGKKGFHDRGTVAFVQFPAHDKNLNHATGKSDEKVLSFGKPFLPLKIMLLKNKWVYI